MSGENKVLGVKTRVIEKVIKETGIVSWKRDKSASPVLWMPTTRDGYNQNGILVNIFSSVRGQLALTMLHLQPRPHLSWTTDRYQLLSQGYLQES